MMLINHLPHKFEFSFLDFNYKNELDLPMNILTTATGGGTDAAFAGAKSKAAVLEGMGLSGDGAHSNNAEYILMESIVPRLYLATRLIMDVSSQ